MRCPGSSGDGTVRVRRRRGGGPHGRGRGSARARRDALDARRRERHPRPPRVPPERTPPCRLRAALTTRAQGGSLRSPHEVVVRPDGREVYVTIVRQGPGGSVGQRAVRGGRGAGASGPRWSPGPPSPIAARGAVGDPSVGPDRHPWRGPPRRHCRGPSPSPPAVALVPPLPSPPCRLRRRPRAASGLCSP
jgi:hypothetical protein